MAIREGQLKHQPLFYVLASIRFQPWMKLHDRIPEIQDLLRERFPVFDQIALASGPGPGMFNPFQQNEPPKPNRWGFHSNDRRIGCQISMDQIVVHATHYEGFSGFSEQVRFVVDAYVSIAKRMDVNVIGIRYLDRISPKSGERMSDYMPKELLPFQDEGNSYSLLAGHTQSSYKTQDGVLQARFWTGSGMMAVPDDLVPLFMLTQDLSQNMPTLPQLQEGDGILDTDSIWQSPVPPQMTSENVIEKLRDLHRHANGFFRKVCSDHAFSVWQGE